jgi:hypothetical protein
MNKKILFIITLVIGIIAIGIVSYYYSATARTVEYVALYTSISTACYTILAEPRAKTEPLLRITPTLKRHGIVFIGKASMGGGVDLNIWIENIGYSIAKNIEVKCQIAPDKTIPLKNNGVYTHSFLAPKEITQYQLVDSIESGKLLSQQLIIEVSYSNENDKKQTPIKKEYPVRELEEGLREVKTS